MQACEIRRMTLDDLDAVVAIEAATFPTPWSRHSFEQELTRNVAARYLVAALDGQVIGYAGAWIILMKAISPTLPSPKHSAAMDMASLTQALLQYLSNLGHPCHPGSARLTCARRTCIPAWAFNCNKESGIMRIIRRMPC